MQTAHPEASENDDLPVHLRDFCERDRAFVLDSWLHSYRTSLANFNVPPSIYKRNQIRVITELLGCAETLIACNPEDPDQIFGYLVAERRRGVVHWLFVKQPFRMLGVAQRLIDAFKDCHHERITVSHMPRPESGFYKLMEKRFKVTYDPSTKEKPRE